MSRQVVNPNPNADGGIPQGVPPKPEAAKFEPPVAWLFGREFIANLKWILLYTAFKGKLDPRDWMNANIIPPVSPQGDEQQTDVEAFWRQLAQDAGAAGAGEEFWFDYISDTGDGQKAVYSIAYLCLSDLAMNRQAELGDELEYVAQPDAASLEAEGKLLLPRGTFLFVGGDTSYHISDYGTLAERFQNPFCWAFADLKEKAASVGGKAARLLLGIPGNHDYYDSLDGFNRQFRRPSTGEAASNSEQRAPQLVIPTFQRMQEASYLALRLPFGWWFWGLDTEEGEIDFRQWEFFDDIRERYDPKKLIIATPEPTTAFGKYASKDENQSKTFAALRLERPFLKDGEPVGEGKCRLDLSGDIHHYARHWGTPRGTQEARNYASVMAGGGGAFFHPSHTSVEEVEPEVIYPALDVSRREVAEQLFKFRNIWQGGYIWLFGAIIAFVIFFAASYPQSSKDAFDTFPPFLKLNISRTDSAQARPPAGRYVREIPRSPWWSDLQSVPAGYLLAAVALGLSVILLGAALFYSSRLFKKEYDPMWAKKVKVVPQSRRIILWALVFVSFVALASGIWGFHYPLYEASLTRFGRSLIITVALAWSALAIIESVVYSGWLFEEAHRSNVKAWHYWPLWALIIMAVLGFGSSLWFFGKHESAFLVADIVLLVVVLLVGGGLVLFAYSKGGGLKKGAGKFAFILLGASHALLQLAVPFLLVRKGHLLLAPLAALIVAVVFKYAGRAFAKMRNGWPLAAAWVAFGAALLSIPFLLDASLPPVLFDGASINAPADGWQKLALCFYAALIGAFTSCVLFGGYLAVALAFNGHNNEAGGAARIEGFKQLVRMRINRDGLTAYVVAFDKASAEGGAGKLRPRIVDVFRVSNV